MKKVTAILFLLAAATGYTQNFETVRIKQLKKDLAILKGTAKVDAMIGICEEYFGIGFFGGNDPRTDSIYL